MRSLANAARPGASTPLRRSCRCRQQRAPAAAAAAGARAAHAQAAAFPQRWSRVVATATPDAPSAASSPPEQQQQQRQQPGGGGEPPPTGFDGTSVLFGVVWLSLLAYAFLYAPNQTPVRDGIFLQKLLNLDGDGEPVNEPLFCLFNIMGLWPAAYAALLVPTGRSRNGVPAWPFLAGSVVAGAFALLPYFALWSPGGGDGGGGASRFGAGGGGAAAAAAGEGGAAEEGGAAGDEAGAKVETRPALERALETRVTAAVLLLAASLLVAKAATAGTPAWVEFGRLFSESRLVHVRSRVPFPSAPPSHPRCSGDERGLPDADAVRPVLGDQRRGRARLQGARPAPARRHPAHRAAGVPQHEAARRVMLAKTDAWHVRRLSNDPTQQPGDAWIAWMSVARHASDAAQLELPPSPFNHFPQLPHSSIA